MKEAHQHQMITQEKRKQAESTEEHLVIVNTHRNATTGRQSAQRKKKKQAQKKCINAHEKRKQGKKIWANFKQSRTKLGRSYHEVTTGRKRTAEQ